jgi:hypothetical protein
MVTSLLPKAFDVSDHSLVLCKALLEGCPGQERCSVAKYFALHDAQFGHQARPVLAENQAFKVSLFVFLAGDALHFRVHLVTHSFQQADIPHQHVH